MYIFVFSEKLKFVNLCAAFLLNILFFNLVGKKKSTSPLLYAKHPSTPNLGFEIETHSELIFVTVNSKSVEFCRERTLQVWIKLSGNV